VRVFHFLNADHGQDDIARRRVRISRFRDLNDPFELLAVKNEDEKFRKGLRSWGEHFDKVYGLLCFSRDWHNPLLWGHYADKHRGLCLGFDLADTLVRRVNYVSERIPLRFEKGDPSRALDKGFVEHLLLTKYEHWRYEDEVRVLIELSPKLPNEKGSYFFPFSGKLVLRNVILGARCKLSIDRVRKDVRSGYGKAASVTQARLAFKRFAVVYDERSVRVENAYRRGDLGGTAT